MASNFRTAVPWQALVWTQGFFAILMECFFLPLLYWGELVPRVARRVFPPVLHKASRQLWMMGWFLFANFISLGKARDEA